MTICTPSRLLCHAPTHWVTPYFPVWGRQNATPNAWETVQASGEVKWRTTVNTVSTYRLLFKHDFWTEIISGQHSVRQGEEQILTPDYRDYFLIQYRRELCALADPD